MHSIYLYSPTVDDNDKSAIVAPIQHLFSKFIRTLPRYRCNYNKVRDKSPAAHRWRQTIVTEMNFMLCCLPAAVSLETLTEKMLPPLLNTEQVKQNHI